MRKKSFAVPVVDLSVQQPGRAQGGRAQQLYGKCPAMIVPVAASSADHPVARYWLSLASLDLYSSPSPGSLVFPLIL